MASILKVDTIQDQDGNNIINESANTITIGASGDTITIPSGATFASVGIDDNATSTAITIDSSENVGIGETAPEGKLHIKTGDSGVTPDVNANGLFIENNGNAGLTIGSSTTGFGIIYFGDSGDNNVGRFQYYHGDNSIRTWTNGSERMRIDSTGKVGIDTSSPIEKMTVNGAIVSTSGNSTLFTSGANRSILDFTSGGTRVGHFRGATASGSGYLSLFVDSSVKMHIDSSGNVGIGTSSPDRFTISGGSSVSDGTTLTIDSGSNINKMPKLELAAYNVANGNDIGQIIFGHFGGDATADGYGVIAAERVSGGGDGDIALTFGTGTSGSTRMRIDDSGHITKPSQPAVHAYSSSAQNNIATGIVTIQLDAEIYDVNSDFNTSTYTFTAPVTGKYLVTMNLVMNEVDTAFQWIYLLGVSSNRNYYLNVIDPRMLVQDGSWSWSGSSLVDMDANDTFIMKTRSSAHGAAQMDIVSGTATSPETQMTITLLS